MILFFAMSLNEIRELNIQRNQKFLNEIGIGIEIEILSNKRNKNQNSFFLNILKSY